MVEEKATVTTENATTTTEENGKKKRNKSLISRIWKFIFRSNENDLEKRLQYISKQEASVLSRMNKRSRFLRRTSRHIIIFSVLFEVYYIIISFSFYFRCLLFIYYFLCLLINHFLLFIVLEFS